MIDLLSIENVLVNFGSYSLSYLEAFAVITGFFHTWLATKNNIHTWSVGTVSIAAFFWLFYQTQLYASMFLQIAFFAFCIIGFVSWKQKEKEISMLSNGKRMLGLAIVVLSSILIAYEVDLLHIIYPDLFLESAAFSVSDSFIMVMSVVATVLLILRKVEAWALWILVDVLAVFVYFQQGIWFVGLQYAAFFFIAIYGLFNWNRIRYDKVQNRLGIG